MKLVIHSPNEVPAWPGSVLAIDRDLQQWLLVGWDSEEKTWVAKGIGPVRLRFWIGLPIVYEIAELKAPALSKTQLDLIRLDMIDAFSGCCRHQTTAAILESGLPLRVLLQRRFARWLIEWRIWFRHRLLRRRRVPDLQEI